MNYLFYDGASRDTTNHTSDRFLALNACGMAAETSVHTLRAQGRVDWHLIYVESGAFSAWIDGKRTSIPPGSCVLYAPGQRQEYWQDNGVRYWAHFSGTAAEEILRLAGILNRGCFPPPADSKPILQAFEMLLFHRAIQSPLRELQLANDLLKLICALGQLSAEETPSAGDERLRSGIIHMHRHYLSPETPEFYARMACLSKGRYMHLFKESTGQSPYAYALGIRYAKAAELLRESALPISEIAARVGMDDPLYFSKQFKKRYGASPEEYRARARLE